MLLNTPLALDHVNSSGCNSLLHASFTPLEGQLYTCILQKSVLAPLLNQGTRATNHGKKGLR